METIVRRFYSIAKKHAHSTAPTATGGKKNNITFECKWQTLATGNVNGGALVPLRCDAEVSTELSTHNRGTLRGPFTLSVSLFLFFSHPYLSTDYRNCGLNSGSGKKKRFACFYFYSKLRAARAGLPLLALCSGLLWRKLSPLGASMTVDCSITAKCS